MTPLEDRSSKHTAGEAKVLAALESAARRDAEKGWTGHRNAREVAEATDMPVRATRSILDRLFNADQIEAVQDGRFVHYRALRLATEPTNER